MVSTGFISAWYNGLQSIKTIQAESFCLFIPMIIHANKALEDRREGNQQHPIIGFLGRRLTEVRE